MPKSDVYLGDGLYASFDGYQVELYASDGRDKTNRVYLDSWVLSSFMKYVESLAHRGRRMIYTDHPAILTPTRFPITSTTPACLECGSHDHLYRHPARGLLCEVCWPKCDYFGCDDMAEPDSLPAFCLKHTREDIACEIAATPLSEPGRIEELMGELDLWTVKETA